MPKDIKKKPLDQTGAAKVLDRVQAGRSPVGARLCGVPVNLIPMEGNSFLVTLSMVNPGAQAAARRLNDVGADIIPWPPEGHCSARMTWDTALHYLVMTGDLAVGGKI